MKPIDDQKLKLYADRWSLWLVLANLAIGLMFLMDFLRDSEPPLGVLIWQVCYLAGLFAAGLNLRSSHPRWRLTLLAALLAVADTPALLGLAALGCRNWGRDDPCGFVALQAAVNIPFKIFSLVLFSTLARRQFQWKHAAATDHSPGPG